MGLDRFLSVPDDGGYKLVVTNRTQPEPFQRMVENLFAEQTVDVRETVDGTYPENTVLLLKDGDVIAESSLDALHDAILMVNSDLYTTGTRSLDETNVPDVIDALTDIRFSLRGYPESNTEKLLLILISRHIERRAYEVGDGVLRSSFQSLSRIKDERGTRRTYRKVSDTDVDVHVYGKPDWRPTDELDVTAHYGRTRDFEHSWFVVYRPPPDRPGERSAALLAIESGDAKWEGFWTYDRSVVDDIAEYIRSNL
ncbi:histidine kinase [Halovenus sp. WSH3]|uniref:Histidine kinase n=1 Tax=Halovenus carboxidivorans TaxID=2692199 RepID=A0A6B0TC88_9EURY|nr:histidine kinase [Halovenus carboxidivorans]MXR50819.1 histidine kinase [Halovenus carboxidivorans]